MRYIVHSVSGEIREIKEEKWYVSLLAGLALVGAMIVVSAVLVLVI